MITNIVEEEITKIIALSDIHGDMHSFIIQLRDCSKVIRKKPIFGFEQNTVDNDLERLLEIDISINDNDYVDDLNYEWIAPVGTVVVICGDIIDPKRTNNCKRNDTNLCNEYPQIEIKLLRFINIMNKIAILNGSRIYKILGNHELMNILYNDDNYTFDKDKVVDNYYRGNKRGNVFNINKEGFKLLFEDNCYLLLKINNNIFVHAKLTKSLDYYEHVNLYINNMMNHNIEKTEEWKEIFKEEHNMDEDFDENNSSIWARDIADESYKERITNDDDRFCTMMNHKIQELGAERLIVGHTPRFATENLNGITYNGSVYHDPIITTYSYDIYTGRNNNSNDGELFGITMECPGRNNMYSIYHVDVGASRAFDRDYTFRFNKIDSYKKEREELYTRTPQVLEIVVKNNGSENIYIIKSNMKNTRIHLPRPNYEKYISDPNINELDIMNPANEHYKKKYISYKQKYLKLKALMNKFNL